MSVSITDEIIDAIIQNETRQGLGPGRPRRPVRVPQACSNKAVLKPDWGQLSPGAAEDLVVADRWSMGAGFALPRRRA